MSQREAEAWERIDAAPWNQTSDAYLRDYDEEYSARMEYEAEQEAERRYVAEHTSAECLAGNHDGHCGNNSTM